MSKYLSPLLCGYLKEKKLLDGVVMPKDNPKYQFGETQGNGEYKVKVVELLDIKSAESLIWKLLGFKEKEKGVFEKVT